MTQSGIPSHVPASLVKDFLYSDMRGETDVYEHFRKLHEGPDIFFTPHDGGYWVATRFADMEHILSNSQDFCSQHQSLPKNPVVLPLIESDGDIHSDFRHVLARFFTPKAIGDLETISRNLTVRLINGFYARGECEFVADFSQKMPIMILMSLLDLPEPDTPYLLKLSEEIVRSGDSARQLAAFGRVAAYIGDTVLPARRAKPGSDIFSALLQAKIDGGRSVTDEEIIGLGTLMIAAGLDTVASMLGFITKFLAESPPHRRQLVEDPSRINVALEEMMRRFQIANIARTVSRDLEYKGLQFKAGDCILVPTSAAGIDPRRYPDPMTVDFARGDRKGLVFGRGPHQCIGAFLARTELRVFLQEWLKRIPQFSVKAGEKPIAVPGKANGMRYLPLSWSVKESSIPP
jgi:cytochrome P450